MPDSCCAVGCSNRRGSSENVSFFRMPSEKKNKPRRLLWIAAIKRESWSEKQIAAAKICSAHFISGNPSADPKSPDYAPSVFHHKSNNQSTSKHKLDRYDRIKSRESKSTATCSMAHGSEEFDSVIDMEVAQLEYVPPCISDDCGDAKGTQVRDPQIPMLLKKIKLRNKQMFKLLEENKKIKKMLARQGKELNSIKKELFCYDNIKEKEKDMKFFTGLENKALFEWVYSLIKDKTKFGSLSLKDHLLVVIMKLKLGLYNKDIAYRYRVSPVVISRIFRNWLPKLSNALKFLIIWPEKEALRKNMPKCFRNYKKCVSIIDCTEVFIERPFSLQTRAITWSNYKNHNTIKYLISITPAGAVSFLSKGWGGRVSDKEITNSSGYLDKLENGDVILADRGFTIEAELATKGASLHIPAFTKGKKQLPGKDVDNSRKIANVRIHVERVIGRLRKFDIMNKTIPISQVDLLDHMVVSVSALVNINPSVVSKQ